ncbi:hypothetical protein M1328_03405 [Patescibacteria group bacterium]|nr:hypothetical protein [Patescibacteria group bacterium]
MSKSINFVIWVAVVGLVTANIFLFYSSIKLGDEITTYETKIDQIHHDNLNLEKDLSEVSSLQYAQSLADKLAFTKKSQPDYLGQLNYAFAPNQ